MGKVQDTDFYNWLKKKQKNLNKFLTSKEIELLKKKKSPNKSSEPNFTAKFHDTFQEKLTLYLHKICQKIKKEFILWSQYYLDTQTR
jgi:hypothetical protein